MLQGNGSAVAAPTGIKLPTLPYGGQAAKNTTGYTGDSTNPFGSIVSALPTTAPVTTAPPTTTTSTPVTAPSTVAAAASSTADPSTAGTSQSYADQLQNDLILQQQLSGINAGATAHAAQLTALRQQALAQFGEIPANLNGTLTGDVNSDVDQTTRDLANTATQSGMSTVAQLQKAYQTQQESDINSLAARGMIHSGALGQHANLDLTAYQQSQSDATQKLLDYLSSAYQTYLGQQATDQSTAVDDTNQALQRIIAQINAGYVPLPAAAASVPDTSGGPLADDTSGSQAPAAGTTAAGEVGSPSLIDQLAAAVNSAKKPVATTTASPAYANVLAAAKALSKPKAAPAPVNYQALKNMRG